MDKIGTTSETYTFEPEKIETILTNFPLNQLPKSQALMDGDMKRLKSLKQQIINNIKNPIADDYVNCSITVPCIYPSNRLPELLKIEYGSSVHRHIHDSNPSIHYVDLNEIIEADDSTFFDIYYTTQSKCFTDKIRSGLNRTK